MLQDIMHNNSISVVEEPVLEPELPVTPHTPTSKNTHTHTHTPVLTLRLESLTNLSSLSLQLPVTPSQW